METSKEQDDYKESESMKGDVKELHSTQSAEHLLEADSDSNHPRQKIKQEVEDDSDHEESNNDESSEEAEETEESRNEVTQLSEFVFIYPNRKISHHGNVFEGEIRSGVYGIRVCAIKFARKSDQNVRESRILTKLGQHSHVISIIQSGIYKDMFDERVYIILDKCHEQNLHEHITHQSQYGLKFNFKEALEYSKQIIAGVTYVHENLIIHKDLKPSNILLSRDKSTIKLADFGLSQEIKSKSSKVYSKKGFGTNGFRPIESFGNNWVSLKSDIFSLGVVLYFILSNGKSPFGDETSLWTYNIHNQMSSLSDLLAPNSNTFQNLINLMLSKERCRRPSIWQIADHPCWSGNEVECNFDYGFSDEICDSDIKILDQGNQDSSDSEHETESSRELLRALQKMGYDVAPCPQTSIIIFDNKSKYLQRFNMKDKSVTRMHEFNEEMKMWFCHYTPVFLNDHIYVLTTYFMYRIRHDDIAAKWERMTNSVSSHGEAYSAVAVAGAIYVAGTNMGKPIKRVSKYNPSTNRWEKVRDKHLETSNAAVVPLNGYIYCIGGKGVLRGDDSNRVERMNVAWQTWDEVAPMRQARWNAAAVECNGNIIVAGGIETYPKYVKNLSSVEKYDPNVNQWTIMKSTKHGGPGFRCHFIDGNVYKVGGWYTTEGEFSEAPIERYDVEKDEWEIFHNFDESIVIITSVVLQKKVSNRSVVDHK